MQPMSTNAAATPMPAVLVLVEIIELPASGNSRYRSADLCELSWRLQVRAYPAKFKNNHPVELLPVLVHRLAPSKTSSGSSGTRKLRFLCAASFGKSTLTAHEVPRGAACRMQARMNGGIGVEQNVRYRTGSFVALNV
jgi:hypothetical protein